MSSTKLAFNEIDLLNAVYKGISHVTGKGKMDATDLNATSKGVQSITKFMDLRHRIFKHAEKNPKALGKTNLYLT